MRDSAAGWLLSLYDLGHTDGKIRGRLAKAGRRTSRHGAEKFSSPHHRDGHIASIVSMNCDEWERGLAVFDLARSDTNDVLGKLVGTARAWA
jgi:hypothetical protein